MAPIQFAYATSPLGSAAAMSQLNGEYNTYSTGHSSVATTLNQVALPEPVYYPRGQNTYSYGLMPPRAPTYTPAFPTAIAEEPCESYTTYPPPYVLPSQDHLSGAHSYGHQDVPSRWTPITCPERTSLGYSVEPESPYTTATVSSVGSSGSRNPSVSTDGRPILPASYSPGPALPAPSAGDRILPRLPGITNDGSCDTSSALTASASGQQPSQYKFIPQGWPDGSTHMVSYPQNRRNSSRSGTATAGTDSKSSVAASSKDSPLSYSANLGSPRGGANGDAGIWYSSSSSNSASLAATTTHNNTTTNSGNCNSNDTNKNNKIHTISSLESLGTPMTPHCSFSSSEASLLPPVSTPAAAILPSQNLASTTNVYSLSTGTTYKRGGGGGNGGIQSDSTGSAEGTLVSGQPYTRLRHTPAQMASSTTAETLRRGSVEPFTQSAHRSSVSSYRA
ncbi:MAG: hypothetical protein M1825_005058 [Sarcosagium campestre]|nr:MAG: hypothetical protein M1825_005058 [Sarcosagium campestre]